tara:strand:+ start:1058 stop:1315 length:258 start_codon:yes stop_codon:yes gene_type:complete
MAIYTLTPLCTKYLPHAEHLTFLKETDWLLNKELLKKELKIIKRLRLRLRLRSKKEKLKTRECKMLARLETLERKMWRGRKKRWS